MFHSTSSQCGGALPPLFVQFSAFQSAQLIRSFVKSDVASHGCCHKIISLFSVDLDIGIIDAVLPNQCLSESASGWLDLGIFGYVTASINCSDCGISQTMGGFRHSPATGGPLGHQPHVGGARGVTRSDAPLPLWLHRERNVYLNSSTASDTSPSAHTQGWYKITCPAAMHEEKQYLDLVREILDHGEYRPDR